MRFIEALSEYKLIILLGTSLVIGIIEYLKPLERSKEFRFDFWNDAILWFLIFDNFLFPTFETPAESAILQSLEKNIIYLREKFSISEWGFITQFLSIFILLEVINYLIHRFLKHGNYLWSLHKIHHSTKFMTQFSDAKNHPFFIFLEGLVVLLPAIFILNPSDEVLILIASIRMIWGPIIHMNTNKRWPFPISHILTSPFTHRWHHSKNHERCNYAGVFIFLDVLLGTFYSPDSACEELGFVNDEKYPRKNILKSLIFPLGQRNDK